MNDCTPLCDANPHVHCAACGMPLYDLPEGGHDNAKHCADCTDSLLCQTCPETCPHCARVEVFVAKRIAS